MAQVSIVVHQFSRRRSLPCLTTTLAVCVCLFTGCVGASPEVEKRQHRERGLSLLADGQYEKAADEFRAVLEVDPADADAYYRLGVVAIQQAGSADRYAGMAELVRATELDRHHREAAMRLADLYLRTGQTAQAKVYILRLLEARSRDPQAFILQGRLAARQQDYRTAVRAFQEAVAADPSLIEGHRQLAMAQERNNESDTAEATLRQAMKMFGPGHEIGKDLGDLLQRTGQFAAAAEVYRETLEGAPDDEALLLRLGETYRRMQAWDKAETLYLEMRVRHPADERPLVWLGDMFRAARRPADARARYDDALKLKPTSQLARDRLIELLLDVGELEQADARIMKIYDDNEKDPMAWYFEGRLRRIRGDLDKAIALFRSVVRLQSDFPLVHLHLGLAFMDKGDRAQALQSLAKAIDLAPSNPEARIALGALYLSEGSTSLAFEQAQLARRLDPFHPGLAALLGDLYVQDRRYDEAQEVLETLRRTQPNDPTILSGLGKIAWAKHDETRAEQLFEDSLRLNPHAYEPLAQLVEMSLQRNQAASARERVLRQMEHSPHNPFFGLLLGKLCQAEGDFSKAEAAFAAGADLIKAASQSSLGIADLYRKTGLLERRVSSDKRRLLLAPHMALGELYERQSDYGRAAVRYREVLKIEPKFAPAAHRLAWIHSEKQQDLDGALAYAQTALETDPHNPHVADTLGWIYYRKNLRLRALTLLQEAAAKLPSEPEVQEHYRVASGRPAKDGAP